MFESLLILAEQPMEPTAPAWAQYMPLLLLVGALFLFLILPARKQRQQQAAMIAALKKNDKIVNSGGIIGVIESIKEKEDEVVLRGGLRVTKSSIVRVLAADAKD